jgi:hypothetical protein
VEAACEVDAKLAKLKRRGGDPRGVASRAARIWRKAERTFDEAVQSETSGEEWLCPWHVVVRVDRADSVSQRQDRTMDNRRTMMRSTAILTFLALLFVLPPAQAQETDCARESIIASFAQATDMEIWVQPYSVCPSQVRRAVRELAVAYELLGSAYLPFAAADDPFQFAPIWQWYPGSAVSMVYGIDPTNNILTLLADSLTEQRDTITSAPVLAYAANGDVTAQVKLTITPLDELHGAGMGIRAAQDENSWVRITRVGDHVEVVSDEAGVSTLVTSLPYEGGQDVYLRIERVGETFAFAYSVNGNDWRIVTDNYLQALPQETQVFLTVFWPVAGGAAMAQFAEMQVNEI